MTRENHAPAPGARKGFLLIEAVLSLALFVIFLGAFGVTVYQGQGQTKSGGDRKRGVKLATEAIEGVRTIAAKDFSSLTPGTYKVVLNSSTGQWSLQAPPATSTGYTVTTTISTIGIDRKLVRAVTTWNITPSRAQTVTVYSVLTNWRKTRTPGNWGGAALSPIATYNYSAGDPGFTDVAVTGSSAFLTSANIPTAGLTVVNLPHLDSPSELTTVDIGGAGYALAIKGNILYVVTSESAAEVKAYDISVPGTPTLLAGYNLPGSGAANSIAVAGDFLYVGATGLGPATALPAIKTKNIAWSPFIKSKNAAKVFWEPLSEVLSPRIFAQQGYIGQCVFLGDGGGASSCPPTSSSSVAVASASSSSAGPYPNGDDFFSFDVSTPSQIRFLDSVYTGGVKGIALFGTAAYLASTVDNSELQVVNITNPSGLSIVGTKPGGSTQDGLSTALGPATLMLGVQNTAAPANGNGRMRLWDLQKPGMPSNLGPWDYTASGSAVRLAVDPTACYSFIASDWYTQALQIVRINPSNTPTLLQSYTPSPVDTDNATSVFYMPGIDRLFLATSKRMFIFAPSSGTNACQ